MTATILILIGVAAFLFLVKLGKYASGRDQLRKLLNFVAEQREGQFWWPNVTFRHPGIGVATRLRLRLKFRLWGGRYLDVECDDWGEGELRFSVRRRSGLWRSLRGWRRVRTGDRRFDRRFIVYGEPREAVLAALAPSVRSRLTVLAAAWPQGFRLETGDGVWRVVLRQPEVERGRLLRVFDTVLELFEEASAINGHGIEIVRSAQLLSSATVCQICGEPLRIDVVYCRQCQTPHHRDCWKYVGRCSTYACGEKRFRRGKPAPRSAASS